MKKQNLFLILFVTLWVVSFTSCQPNEPKPTFENGYEYVDLGLSVRWASCNVGAGESYEIGDFFAWGEVNAKSDYSWATYQHGSGKNELQKYTLSEDGSPVVLGAEDDAASVLMGGEWRMPTREEFVELKTKCTWAYAQMKETLGYYITGPSGKSIFMPAGGFKDETHHVDYNSAGYYWTSTLDNENAACSISLDFVAGNSSVGSSSRFYGQSIRGVLPYSESSAE